MHARTFLFTTLVVALISTASARNLLVSGYWTSYQTDDAQICGMYVRLTGASVRAIHIKFVRGTHQLFIMLFKTDWRFPNTGVQLTANFSIDNKKLAAPGWAASEQVSNTTINSVRFFVDPAYTNGFLADLAAGNWLYVDFNEGNEPRWSAPLIGTREVATSFAKCIIAMGGLQQRPPQTATQPYDPKTEPLPTIPVPTQPATPTTPIPTTPVQRPLGRDEI